MPTASNQPKPARTVALCYSRKSDIRDGVDMVSIIWQDDVVERECQRRGWTPEWYRDTTRHNSARHEHNRKQWTKLRQRVGAPEVAAVVVAIQDRASRSVRHTAELVEQCIKNGVDLIAPADGLDTTRTGWDAQTIATINLRASFAQLESDLASQRLKRRVKQYNDAGIPWGTPPFGIVRVGAGLSAVMEGDEDAPTVSKILTLFGSGLSYDETTTHCQESGLLFRDLQNHPIAITRESVRTVVGNVPFYAGYLVSHFGWDAKNTRITLEGEGGYLERYARALGALRSPAIRPIITDALADIVIERRYKGQITSRKGAWTPLLTPIVWWTGKRLRAEGRSYGLFYTVRSAAGPRIDAETTEKNLIKRLAGLRFPAKMIEHIRQIVIAQTSDTRRVELHDQMERMKRERATLLELRLKGEVSAEDYSLNYGRIEQVLRTLQAQLDMPTSVEQTLNSLGDIASTIELMNRDAQRRTIHRMFERIDLTSEGEIERVKMKPWFHAALHEMKTCSTTPPLPKVGIDIQGWRNLLWLLHVGGIIELPDSDDLKVS